MEAVKMKKTVIKFLLIVGVVGHTQALAESEPNPTPEKEAVQDLEKQPKNDDYGGPRRDRVRDQLRQQLSEEQKQALINHKDSLQSKNQELQSTLKSLNSEYAELSDKENKTREEQIRLIQLRRELLANSPEAQTKLNEIKQLNSNFAESNPDLSAQFGRGVNEAHAVKNEIDSLLAAQSPEYATLLAKENKTPEDRERLKSLRQELIKDNPQAQELRLKGHANRERIRDRHENRRERRENRRQDHQPEAAPGDADIPEQGN